MSGIFRDRAYCVRTTGLRSHYDGERCHNTKCDRFAGLEVLRLSAESKVPIGWADLKTSKCGFKPEKEAKR